jgi:hypothetical protein
VKSVKHEKHAERPRVDKMNWGKDLNGGIKSHYMLLPDTPVTPVLWMSKVDSTILNSSTIPSYHATTYKNIWFLLEQTHTPTKTFRK